MTDDVNSYNKMRYRRKKHLYRLKLGCSQLIRFPLLLTVFAIIIITTAFLITKRATLLAFLNIPKTIYPFIDNCLICLIIITAILVAISIILGIGELTARKDEGNIAFAFEKKDLRNGGCPILTYKKLFRDSIIREFYTTIPMEKWLNKKEAIADIFSEHFLIDFEYGGKNSDKANFVVMKSIKGRTNKEKGVLYDEI